MKPRYYIHMGPRPVEKVSYVWKIAHITIYFLLVCSSSVATVCIYNILEIYNFNCILYAKVSFEQTYEERIKIVASSSPPEINTTKIVTEKTPEEVIENPPKEEEKVMNDLEKQSVPPDCIKDPTAPGCNGTTSKSLERVKRALFKDSIAKNGSKNDALKQVRDLLKSIRLQPATEEPSQVPGINITGFLNMRKTVFSTIYMCDLMLFAPLASIIFAIFLGAIVAVAGKGGAGNPGDLLPNPWICVYPFLGFCCFMMIFSFISDNLFHNGLYAFCRHYENFTMEKGCSKHMDEFNVQFTPDKKGPPQPFGTTYNIGSIGVQLTSALWVVQMLLYVIRIACLADFSLILTRIRRKEDEGQDPKMANVVMDMIDTKHKVP